MGRPALPPNVNHRPIGRTWIRRYRIRRDPPPRRSHERYDDPAEISATAPSHIPDGVDVGFFEGGRTYPARPALYADLVDAVWSYRHAWWRRRHLRADRGHARPRPQRRHRTGSPRRLPRSACGVRAVRRSCRPRSQARRRRNWRSTIDPAVVVAESRIRCRSVRGASGLRLVMCSSRHGLRLRRW